MSFKEFLGKNWIWAATVIFGLGGAFVWQAVQGADIKDHTTIINTHRERIALCEQADIKLNSADEKALMKLEAIDNGIKDLKTTVEKLDVKMNERMTKMSEKNQLQFDEMKKILYKPAISGMYGVSNLVSVVD